MVRSKENSFNRHHYVKNFDFRTHKLLKVIEMPTQLVVNLAFGGPNLDVLFVTSAKGTLGIYSGKSTNQTLTDVAGSLFMIEGLNARGFNGRKLNLLKKNVC